MRYVIRHQTRIAFASPVREHHCELRVAPVDDASQRRLSLRLATEPAARPRTYTDAFGNLVHYLDVLAPHPELVTLLEAEVETLPADRTDGPPVAREPEWIAEALRAHPPLWDFVLHRSAFTPGLEDVRAAGPAPAWTEGTAVIAAVGSAMAWVRRVLADDAAVSAGETSLADVVARGAGDARDLAHLLVTVVRSWGLPARYVTGYLDPGSPRSGDLSTHAWAEVLVPGAGWRGFDAVHGRMVDETYVRVAVGRDHRDTAPRRGTFHGAHGRDAPEVRLAMMRQYQQ